MKSLKTLLLLAAVTSTADAGSLTFGGQANNVSGLATVSFAVDGATVTLEAFPRVGGVASVLDERSRSGLGVNSRTIAGVIGGPLDKLNLITSADPALHGLAEAITLTFDRPGVLTGVDFDGLKDESLEYFVLTTATGDRVEFFDSAANTTSPGAVDAAVTAGIVTGEVVYLLEGGGFDDEIAGLAIPFAAGEPITITYAELGAAFNPIATGDGARLQGFSFRLVPEPASVGLLAVAATLVRRRSQRTA